MTRRPLLIGAVFIGVITLIIFTYWTNFTLDSENNSAAVKPTIRLALAKTFITGPLLIALKQNYFEEEGLNIQVVGEYSSGKESFEKMLKGDADISTIATTPAVFNSFKRKDYSIFVSYLTSYDGVKIIARKDRNINEPVDLKQKMIGIVPGTISQILLDSFLSYNKIFIKELKLKHYKGSELPNALVNGEVDAISIWEPYAYFAQKRLRDLALKIPTYRVYRTSINMAVMNDFAAKNPMLLQKVIKALIKAVDFMKNEKSQSQNLMAEILDLDINLVEEFWKDVKFTIGLDQLLIITMENEIRWAIEHGIVSTPVIPNYLDFINYEILEQVKPEAVTLIRATK